ncbi:MAG: aminotransferase class I/II-fold pyridoxal phosphate-dependent enzyme [Pseudomonadales bacterium]|jgi:cystathionine beta-lyase
MVKTDLNRRRFLQGSGAAALAGVVGAGTPGHAAPEPPGATPPYLIDGRYDFDTPYSRIGTDCTKWDAQIELFGEGVQVGMGIADLDFRVAPCITEAMLERMRHENWGYLNRDLGFASLKEAISAWNSDRHGVAVHPESIVIANGVHPGLIAGITTFSPPGSRVLLMTPTYNGFYSDLTYTSTIANESEMVFENGRYHIDWDDLEARMTPDTHTMLLCNPQNPTGNVWSEEDLLRIGELCLKHEVVVLADEIHADFVRPGHRYTPFASLPDREIVDNSLTFKAITKSFNLPASKNAYWFSTNPVYLERARKNHRADINTLGVVANEAAYRHGADWLDQLLVYIDGNHAFVERYLAANLPQVRCTRAQGTFLSWLHFDGIMDAVGVAEMSAASQSTDNPMTETQAFEAWLVANSGVQLNDGEGYGKGSERCMRMNIGTSRQLIELALDNMTAAIATV